MADPTAGSDSDMAAEIGIVSADGLPIGDFYRQAFGFSDVSSFTSPAGSVYKMRRGEARLKIFVPVDPPERDRLDSLGRRTGICYFALYVDDIAGSFDRAVELGAEVISSPKSHRPGAIVALIRDPEGNIVELLEDPSYGDSGSR
jgi:PhnB protein